MKIATSMLIRTVLLLALIIAPGFAATGFAPAQDRAAPVIQLAGSNANSLALPFSSERMANGDDR
jgi:hypothetical protein